MNNDPIEVLREAIDKLTRAACYVPADQRMTYHEASAAVEQLLASLSAPKPESAEAVAWHTEDHLTDKSATTYDPAVRDRWIAKGWPVTSLFTAPPRPEASAPVGVEGLPEKWRREAPRARVDVGEDASLAWREAVYWCAFQLEAALHTTAAQEE